MNKTENRLIHPVLIIFELIVGVILGSILFNIDQSGTSSSQSYFSGIVKLYGGLSLTFFFSVYLVGIIGQNILGQVVRFKKAISLSILFWLVSIIIYTSTFNFFSYGLEWREISVYIILTGIIFGFNLGIYLEGQKIKNNETQTMANKA